MLSAMKVGLLQDLAEVQARASAQMQTAWHGLGVLALGLATRWFKPLSGPPALAIAAAATAAAPTTITE